MKEKNKKKEIAKISIFITSIFVILLSVTYAFMTETLTGTKKVTISAGTLSLVLDEKNEITISDGLPMYDAVGMIQDEVFTFDLINETSNPTAYTLKLQKVSTSNELQLSDVKYYLTKDGVGQPTLLSSLAADGTVDTGTIAGNQTIEYTLRLWIRDGVTDITTIQGKSLSYKLKVEAGQGIAKTDTPSVDWAVSDGYIENIQVGTNQYLVKISDEVVDTNNLLGVNAYIEMNDDATSCGSSCVMEGEITDELLNSSITTDETTGFKTFNNMIYFASETYTQDGVSVTPGVWVVATKDTESDMFVPMVNAFAVGNTEQEVVSFTFAGITEEATTTTKRMFNYSSEGCIMDMATQEQSCPAEATNGIYTMSDDDGPSYFYRGEVDNLVKFGSYTKDYYVYRYISGDDTYDFSSLDACKYYNSSCSESNKVLKYVASDNVPMYWRIVRINGDGTIRMIYSGTSPDAEGQELGIGLSRYNEESNDPKYAGYTYDKTSTEVKSDAKTEIDNWYSNVLEGTEYDSKIATGKFCSDSSDYGEITFMGSAENAFGPLKRAWANTFGIGNANPTFKCSSATDANFGGSYNLKAGLMTLDEVVAAGGQLAENQSSYLFDSQGFWSLSPFSFDEDFAFVGYSVDGIAFNFSVNSDCGSLRPVINLRADVTFKSGTNGSTTTPYELAE